MDGGKDLTEAPSCNERWQNERRYLRNKLSYKATDTAIYRIPRDMQYRIVPSILHHILHDI